MQRERCGGDGGQAVPLLVAVLAIGMVAVVAVGGLARGAVDAARARTAADAAALAGVTDGPPAAADAARANGGTMIWFRRAGADVVVRVQVGTAAAEARATLREVTEPP